MTRGLQNIPFEPRTALAALREGINLMWSGKSEKREQIVIMPALPIWFCGLKDFVDREDWDEVLIFAGWRMEIQIERSLQVIELVRTSEDSEDMAFFGVTEGPLVDATGRLMRSQNARALVRLIGIGTSFLVVEADRSNRLIRIMPATSEQELESMSFAQAHEMLRPAAVRALQDGTDEIGPEPLTA